MKIAILGAGSWGTALGHLLQDNGSEVLLWHLNADFVQQINSSHRHPFLPEVQLNDKMHFTSSLDEIASYGDMMVLALPSQVIREVLLQLPKEWNKPIISVSKGIENNTGLRVSEIVSQVLDVSLDDIIVLSGPPHAEEVARKYPCAIVSASKNQEFAQKIQEIFSNENFRVYASNDIVGVEIGGASKNIIAIAAGICHGLGFGDNTIAALVTRGLEEIIRLGISLGAERATFSGLSGVGDLVVTAYSKHSRNRQVGIRIGQGEKLQDISATMNMIAEGVDTSRSIYNLSKSHNIEMPICDQVYKVLFANTSPRDAILELMRRELVNEHSV